MTHRQCTDVTIGEREERHHNTHVDVALDDVVNREEEERVEDEAEERLEEEEVEPTNRLFERWRGAPDEVENHEDGGSNDHEPVANSIVGGLNAVGHPREHRDGHEEHEERRCCVLPDFPEH